MGLLRLVLDDSKFVSGPPSLRMLGSSTCCDVSVVPASSSALDLMIQVLGHARKIHVCVNVRGLGVVFTGSKGCTNLHCWHLFDTLVSILTSISSGCSQAFRQRSCCRTVTLHPGVLRKTCVHVHGSERKSHTTSHHCVALRFSHAHCCAAL